MSDATLVIGARNEAAAVLNELGEQLQALAIPAQQTSLQIDSALNGVLTKLGYSAAAVTGAFGATAIAIGSVATGAAVKAIRDESEAMEKLNIELDNYVGASRISEETARAFAAVNREVLHTSQAQTLSLMTTASSLGVASDKLDEAAIAAIGLSKSLGISVDAALKKVTDGDDRLVSMLDSVNNGLNAQGEELEGIAELWAMAERASKQALELITEATQPIQAAMLSLGKSITEGLTHALVGTISALEVYKNDAATVNEYVATRFALAYEQISETTRHVLTVQLPAYWEWYVNNAYKLMSDGFSAMSALSTNWITLTAEAMSAVSSYMTGAIDADAFKLAMLEAIARPFDELELRAEKLPEVIGQKMTARERELTDKLNKLGSRLGSEFSDTFAENLKKFEVEPPQLKQADLDALRQSKEDESAKQSSARQQELRITESRLLTRGPMEKGIDKVARATEKTAQTLDEIKVAWMNQASQAKIEFVGIV